jgi:hypothetical protein
MFKNIPNDLESLKQGLHDQEEGSYLLRSPIGMVQVNIMNPEASDLLNGWPLDSSLQLLRLGCCEARVSD